MNEEAIFLLKMLSCFVREENPGTFCGDCKKLLQLASIHNVAPIAGYMFKKYPQPLYTEEGALLWNMCLDSIMIFAGRNERMAELKRLISAAGIDILLFKGYVLKDYYPVPELRTYFDIDFLIHPADRKKLDCLMIENGFERKNDWEPVYSYYKGNEYYEVHTDIMEVSVTGKANQNEYFKHIWEHAVKIDEHIYEIEPEYHFLYLLTHIAKHINNSGAGIRLYMDLAVFCLHFGDIIDWSVIQTELNVLKLERFTGTVMMFVEKFFGVSVPLCLPYPQETVLNQFTEFTVAGGIFGRYGRDPGLFVLNKKSKNKKVNSRILAFMKYAFPSAEVLKSRYTYLDKRPWLLPFAWIHRIIKNRNETKLHYKEARGIFKTSSKDINDLKTLIEKIGL